jgi:hypothetical protein
MLPLQKKWACHGIFFEFLLEHRQIRKKVTGGRWRAFAG